MSRVVQPRDCKDPAGNRPAASARRRIAPDMRVANWSAPDGWGLRAFDLPARQTSRGSVLFLGGRGDFFEKYLEAIEHWANHGWNVSGFDWRGQGGSGRTHPLGLCHVEEFGSLVADLAAFCADWPWRTGPRVAIGHSMGAHVLLRAAAEGRVELDRIVLLSPMVGIRAGPFRGWPLRRLAGLGRTPGLRQRPVWRGSPGQSRGRVTACEERHADKLWWKAQCPDLARGAPTWSWLAAATKSMSELEQRLRREPLQLPGLILTAKRDPVIDLRAVERIRPFLPACEHNEIYDAGHELLRERDDARLACLARIGHFLEQTSVRRRGQRGAAGLRALSRG